MQNKVLEKFMNLKITNVWMFPKVFGDPDNIELSREMIKRCIGREVEEIKLIVPESTETAGYETHGVRYDVKFKGEDKLYIVEMQNYTDSLIKRGNYEASVAMVDSFDPSDDYDNVQNIMVIYICTFDYYGLDEARYVVEQKVVGHGELNEDTNLSIIILNTTARRDSEEDQRETDNTRWLHDTRICHQTRKKARSRRSNKESYGRSTEDWCIEFCKKMLQEELDVDLIVKCTGLSKEKVIDIKNQMNK